MRIGFPSIRQLNDGKPSGTTSRDDSHAILETERRRGVNCCHAKYLSGGGLLLMKNGPHFSKDA